jgi:hypothetical protein
LDALVILNSSGTAFTSSNSPLPTYIGDTLGNGSGDSSRAPFTKERLNLAVDADLQKLMGLEQLTFRRQRLPDYALFAQESAPSSVFGQHIKADGLLLDRVNVRLGGEFNRSLQHILRTSQPVSDRARSFSAFH